MPQVVEPKAGLEFDTLDGGFPISTADVVFAHLDAVGSSEQQSDAPGTTESIQQLIVAPRDRRNFSRLAKFWWGDDGHALDVTRVPLMRRFLVKLELGLAIDQKTSHRPRERPRQV